MLILDTRQNAIVLRDRFGPALWRGTLVLEDEEGQHTCSWDEGGAGRAGQWEVKLSFSLSHLIQRGCWRYDAIERKQKHETRS